MDSDWRGKSYFDSCDSNLREATGRGRDKYVPVIQVKEKCSQE